LDFLSELVLFSKVIDTRKILSRIPPWAAISLWNTKFPASFFNALENGGLALESRLIEKRLYCIVASNFPVSARDLVTQSGVRLTTILRATTFDGVHYSMSGGGLYIYDGANDNEAAGTSESAHLGGAHGHSESESRRQRPRAPRPSQA
jgi:hypothetical protein